MQRAAWSLGLLLCAGNLSCQESSALDGSLDAQSELDATSSVDSGEDAGVDLGLPPIDMGLQEDLGFADAGPLDALTLPEQVTLRVTLDGTAVQGATVSQGGLAARYLTNTQGEVTLPITSSIAGNEVILIASHQEARQDWIDVRKGDHGPVEIKLTRFSRQDNLDYEVADPGEPTRRGTTGQCAHCHQTINEDWYSSMHRTSASNPRVHDLYSGVVLSISSASECQQQGGQWLDGLEPGTGNTIKKCFKGDSLLATINPDCTTPNCEENSTHQGDCAACHAPGIKGPRENRGLLEARGFEYSYGVSCDVCHRVEKVNDQGPPGVLGRLGTLRPSEMAPVGPGSDFVPLTFGPSHDSPNNLMGSVQRDHFRQARFCAGCHELSSEVLVPGQSANPQRWPQGILPVQTTYQEWQAGPFAQAAPCHSCHMPPNPGTLNAADMQRVPESAWGLVGGWPRPPGAVRHHSFLGPRTPGNYLLSSALAVFVQKEQQNGTLTARVRVKNVAAGHAVPTGEPMRQVLLRVEAFCETSTLAPSGGQVLPSWAGAIESKSSTQSWQLWSQAQVGDSIRVIHRPGNYLDYSGFGPFGDGRFSAQQKGLLQEDWVDEVRVTAVQNGRVQTDLPLPSGSWAYLIRESRGTWAGAPGFAFARILEDAQGKAMVPHFRAIDVVADNRLMPGQSFETIHRFRSSCSNPRVRARVYYRAYPWWLAEERGWSNPHELMTESIR